ncbi:MAG: tyrosine--tRNA ligase [Nitrososphaerota archaeon]|jgi:tyrosyl-tRNA synthetase|nr:tyrosine--tRNA ligase [Nitrososphaerota archaeon]MDG6956051.1 tyrosine--tRNA ligase [Nitrososphaerota archaeon]MDG6957717.1 tyrosine--tRNA ligase [Nitrososphaerota archaeon]MDG6968942.1 tyrosine--tRNA ligase [Nitrososphaerota archaeon]MDG6973279.1 tyrosine--tRNA ligase [Nitrososphaerota archaeon]
MDLEERLALIKGVGEEVITEGELRALLQANDHPTAYDGFEPSGLAHLPFGVLRPILVEDMLKAGVRMKLWIADWFAWVNNKMGGDLERIQDVGRYFVEVWKAAGVDMDKVDVLWTSDAARNEEYWKKVVTVAQNFTLARAQRALTIAGRTSKEAVQAAQLLYPMMQVADIFWLDVDICQLGLDQRRANILAREIAEKLKWKKPVAVHHHMLIGLQGKKEPEGFDENGALDSEIASKMSKSKPESSIFVHDGTELIRSKVNSAYCPPKVVAGNALMDYSRYIIFRKQKALRIERPEKYGGTVEFASYRELEDAYAGGLLHPADLKKGVAEALDAIIAPIRDHFEKDPAARRLYESVRSAETTR